MESMTIAEYHDRFPSASGKYDDAGVSGTEDNQKRKENEKQGTEKQDRSVMNASSPDQ